MSWLSSLRGGVSRKEPAAKGSGAQTLTAEESPEVHRSLALPAMFAALARGHKLNVLDLGAALGSNVERLSEFGCRLDIEDLYASKAAAAEGGSLGADFFADFLASAEGRQFDLVLAWDLFNYLDRKELAELGRRLRLVCRPGALVFALVSYHKTIPAQPIRFRFIDQDQDQLIYERRTTVERPGPRFAPAEFNELLRGFRVDRSFLLRHGIQEYLFVREGA
jgi:hypothetical protein